MSNELRTELEQGIDQLGLTIRPEQIDKLLDYLNHLVRWNHAYNLTSVRDPHAMIVRHLLDSLAVIPYLRGPRLLDVGTGAGLPGIPIAITCPDIRVTLMDSNGKKIRFVRQMMIDLPLQQIEMVQSRVERYQSDRKFNTIVCRALAPLPKLVTWTDHLMARDGQLLAMKGQLPVEEIENLRDGRIQAEPLRIPGLKEERHLIIYERQ